MSPPKMPDWAYNQMIEGLQKLLVLRLQGSPPADTISALAAVWEEALTPITWAWQPETDGARLPAAFRRLISQAEKWAQPAQLIKQIEFHFNHYKDLKKPGSTIVKEFAGVDAAKQVVAAAIERWNEQA